MLDGHRMVNDGSCFNILLSLISWSKWIIVANMLSKWNISIFFPEDLIPATLNFVFYLTFNNIQWELMNGWFVQFLKFIQAQIRELKVGQSNYTATVLLIGIPNVGKSAIANSLHQIGRISAAGIDHKFSTYQNKLTILWIGLWAIFWTTSLFFLLSHGCHYILCMLISREGKVETCNCKSITRGDKGYQQF